MPLSTSSLEMLFGVSVAHAAGRLAELTPRETEVAGLLADGLTAQEIGKLLGIAVGTVDIHRKGIKDKLGVKTTVQIVRLVLLKRLADSI
jgi:DNA-binding CsgD family transcriptional regulator